MAQPTEGEWRVLGTSQIYAGDKMIAMAAIKDVSDLAERVANLEVMAAGKDLLVSLEALLKDYEESDFDIVGKSEELIKNARVAIKKARKTELQTKQ